MKLKKWGSLLTALAMVGSMATYVPASVSAAEADVLTHSGTFTYAPEVSFNITEYPATTLDNGDDVAAKNVLTIYATTDGATYKVPNDLIKDVAYEFRDATTVLDETKYDTAAAIQKNIQRVVISGNAVLDNAVVAGEATPDVFKPIEGNDLVTPTNNIVVQIDCRATVETVKVNSTATETNLVSDSNITFVAGSNATAELDHDYAPNTTYNNHVCVNCNDVDISFEAHDFTKTGGTVNTTKGTHTCKCGKTDADYLVKNDNGTYMTVDECQTNLGALVNYEDVLADVNGTYTPAQVKAAKNMESILNYKSIHGFATGTHKCGVCNAYDVVEHQGTNLTYQRGESNHTVTCATCGYAGKATAHTYATYWAVDNDNNLANGPFVTVANRKIQVGWHYCTVCGYVPGVTFDETTGNSTGGSYTGSHIYDSKFVYQWDETVENLDGSKGAYVKTIVTATTAAEKTVCKCGAKKTSHSSHSYNNLNNHHLCYCGDEQVNHSFDFNYTVTGDATVNGEKGWSNVGANKGAVCSCGLVADGIVVSGVDHDSDHIDDYTDFKDIVDASLKGKNEPGYAPNTSFYTDTTTGKHYCTCGEEVVYAAPYTTPDRDSVAAAAGDPIHYYVNAKGEQHVCICGKVNDNVHVYADTDTVNSGGDETENVGYYIVAKNTSGTGSYQLIYVTKDTVFANYKEVICSTPGTLTDGSPLAYDDEKGVFCKCGKLNPTHVHDFSDPAMCIDGVHYCACGKASEEHDFDTKTNKCKVCGEYIEHDHKPTSNTDCTCAICGEPAHQLIKFNSTHKCSICSKTVDAHVYEADTTNHTHTCTICGYTAVLADNVHRYGTTGTAQCICTECGFENHIRDDGDNKETEKVIEKHFCTKCDADLSDEHKFDYVYDATTPGSAVINDVTGYTHKTSEADLEKCVICACGEIKTGHVCEFYGNAPSTTTGGTIGKVDRAGVTVKPNDEYCACGKVLSHKLGLATEDNKKADTSDADASYHACVNTIENDVNGNGVIENDVNGEVYNCTNPAVAHNFPSSVVSGKTVYATFCTGCGAVNPEKLNRARFVSDILKAPTTTASTDAYVKLCVEQHNKYISTYTTSYIVSLTKDTKAVLAYDTVKEGATVTKENDGTFTYDVDFNDADSVTAAIGKQSNPLSFYSAPADVAEIKIAATTAEQTAFNKLLSTFNTTDTAASKNLSGGYIKIEYITDSTVATAVGDDGANKSDESYTEKIYGQVGKTVDIKMLVNDGYKFSGWYSDEKATKLISADQIASVTVANGETKVYALIEANETKMIDIPANVKYWSTFTQPDDTKSAVDYDQTVKFSVGETVYMQADNVTNFVSFNNKNGNAFVYNYDLDEDGTIEATNDDCYAFTVRYADSYTMKTSPTVSAGKVYVIFKNSSNDRTLSQGMSDTNGSVAAFEPDAPAQAGKTFVGWKDITDPTNTVVRTKTIAETKSGVVTLVPLFKNRTDLKLTLENGSFLDAAQEAQNATGFEYGTPVKITAPEKNTKTGKYFSGWYNGDELVYGTRTVAHIITDTVTLTAKYEGSSELKAETSYVLSSKRNETSTGEQVVLTASWNIIEDVTVLETGYVFTLAGASADKLTIENVDGSNVQIQKTGLKSKYAVYNFNMNLKDSTGASAKTVTAKFYVNYIDANGIEHTIYTDAVTEAPLS